MNIPENFICNTSHVVGTRVISFEVSPTWIRPEFWIMNIPKIFECNVVVTFVISFEISYTWPKPITTWEASPTRLQRATYENTILFTLSKKFEHLPLDKT